MGLVTPTDYIKLKAEVESLKKSEAKAQVLLDVLLTRLKEFNCKTVKEAKALLEEKRVSLETLQQELAEKESAFREKWKEKLK